MTPRLLVRGHVVGVIAVVLLAGCGGQQATGHATDPVATTLASGPPSPSTTRPTAAADKRATIRLGDNAPTTTASAGPSTAAPPPNGPLTNTPIRATADRPCVHPGDTQGLTVHGEPRDLVIYDTDYSDGSDDYTGHYGTGAGRGADDPDGLYHTTWVMAPRVPPGPAVINVGTTWRGQLAMAQARFLIVPPGHACP